MVNPLPQLLKLLLMKILVQPVLRHLRFRAIHNHFIQGTVIKDSLDQRMHNRLHRLQG